MWSIPYYNSANLKANELWNKAKFIGFFDKSEGKSIGLYSLDKFYVELTYDRFKDAIIDLVAISVDEALEKYLNRSRRS